MPESQTIPWRRVSVEAAAIVASILLAFSIQAWWEQRNEADLEQRILSALLQEFENNSELLQQAREDYEQRYNNAVRLLNYLDQDNVEIDEAELERLIRSLFLNKTFHLESGAHDSLVTSGELNVIHDELLRNRLAAWPSFVAEWSEEEDSVFAFVKEVMEPYFMRRIRLRNHRARLPSFPTSQSLAPIPVGSFDAAAFVELADSVEFDNLVFKQAQGNWYAMRDGETLGAELAVILDLIRQNLDE